MNNDQSKVIFTLMFACGVANLNSAYGQKRQPSEGLIGASCPSKVKVRVAGRIVKGAPAAIEGFPFMVSIQKKQNAWQHVCGGSIFNPTVILTACHCVVHGQRINGNQWKPADATSMRVVAGSSDWNKPTPGRQIVKVSKLMAHPGCSNFAGVNKVYNNDVGVVILQTPLKFTYTVQPFKLVSYDIPTAMEKLRETVLSKRQCYTPGWGFTVEATRTVTTKLMVAAVIPMTSQQCRERFCRLAHNHCQTDFYKIHQMCVLSADSSNCYGDSGGPLICNGYVYGTVSYGQHCYPGWPTVFQNIHPILEILNSTTGYSLPQGPSLQKALRLTNQLFRRRVVQTAPTGYDVQMPARAIDIVNAIVSRARYFF